MQRLAYRKFTEQIFDPDNCDRSKKKFWHFVKQKRKDSCNIAPMRRDGVLISDSLGKANILNKQYSSVFTPVKDDPIPTSPTDGFPVMSHITIDPIGVKKMLTSLDINKAAGPDRISPPSPQRTR